MQTFKIKNATNKEWNDKRFVECYLYPVDADGNELDKGTKVSFWNGEITEPDGTYRSTITGELSKNQKGYDVLLTPKKVAGGNFKADQIKVAQDRKEQSINRAMDRKEVSIAYFNSRNTAIEFVKDFCAKDLLSPSEALSLVEKYTEVFFDKWKNWNDQPF